MKRIASILLLVAASTGCATSADGTKHGRMGGVSPGQFHVIPASLNPSVSGYPGAVGDIIQNAGSLSAWVRNGSNATDWQAFPASPGITYTAGTGISLANNAISTTPGTLSWWDQRKAHCEALLNYNGMIQVDHASAYDYSRTAPVLTGGTITIDSQFDGTVYALTGSAAVLNDMPVSGTKTIASPKSSSWCVSRLTSFAGALTSSYAIPLGLDNGGSYIEFALNFSTSATHFYLLMGGGTGTASVDLGASIALGSAQAPIGVAAPVTVTVYHDLYAGALVVEVDDVEVYRTVASSGGLDAMPTAALALDAQANNGPLGMRVFGGFSYTRDPSH